MDSMARSGLSCWGGDIMLLLGKLNMLQLWTTAPTSLPRAINDVACAIKLHWKSWLNNEIATTRFYSLLYLPMSPLALAAHLSAGTDIKFRIALTRLRTGYPALILPIITDSWRNIERDGRICNLGKHDVGDEFHFLFTSLYCFK